jgi:hypothetical protein
MDDSGDRFFDNHVIDMSVDDDSDDDNELLMMVTLLMHDNNEKSVQGPMSRSRNMARCWVVKEKLSMCNFFGNYFHCTNHLYNALSDADFGCQGRFSSDL